ncbi:MAG: hypothetical protein ACK5HY_02980, partial [Parahaliea sp.]
LAVISRKRSTMSTTFPSTAVLPGSEGTRLGHSEWVEITQQRIDQFADATGDRPACVVDTISRFFTRGGRHD